MTDSAGGVLESVGGAVATRPAEPAAIADPALLDEFLEWFASYARTQTVRTYGSALRDFIRRMAIHDLRTVTGEVIDRYRGRLFMAGLSESTRQMRGQSAPRKFFRWLVRRGHVAADPTKDLEPMQVRFMEEIPVLTRAEIARLTFRCPPAPEPIRGRREPRYFFLCRLELHNLAARYRAPGPFVRHPPPRRRAGASRAPRV